MRPLARLNRFYWKYKHLFIPGLLCAVASASFSIMVPMVVRRAVDGIPRFVSTYQTFENTPVAGYLYTRFFVTLALFGVVILCLSLISGVFSFLMRQTVVVASRHIEFDLRNELYDHLQKLSRAFYLERPTGDIITRATSDIEQVRRYIGPAIMYLTRATVIVVTAMTVMFIISPRLTLFAIIPMPFLALSVFFVAKMVHSRSEALQAQYSSLTSRVQEALAGIRVIKAYTRENAESIAFDDESRKYRTRMLDLAMVEAAWRPVFLLLVGMATIIVVWVGGRLVVEGSITIGNIAEYIIYVAMMTWPVASMGFVITMVQRASASIIRLGEILDTEPAIADDASTDDGIRSIDGGIAFDQVGFRYTDDGPPVLQDVTFDVPAGSTLAIVGRTGSGKSTIVEMIPRLLEPVEGQIRIDGRDIRSIPLGVLRQSIGYVPQDVFLFSDTVANNIAFGNMDAVDEAIREAASESELLDNVEELREGFETYVGERGITLSGGQKQRTSIARALIRQPGILILDDALSAVDTDTERRILRHLKKHYGRRTIVLVSHRVSAVQDADLIIVLDEGRIVERGSHDELLLKDGLYANLYRKQLLEEEIESIN
ncbi:MAG: ABC transporter ATP-binding protein/permease [Rhodothermia bacterium]|nr:ABC transporter ATP-binding protein/permease [Rhodothermia bacterium]